MEETEEISDIYDITVIGGGPTGLYGAFYAGLRQMKTKIIESMGQLGGQLAALYPEKYIYDVGGFPKVLAKDLVAMSSEQALQNAPTVCLEEKVLQLTHIEGEGATNVLKIVTDKGTHYTRTVLIAAGVGAFLPRKLDGVHGLAELEDRGVYYFVTDTSTFKDKDLVIVGGGDSAFDWSLALGPQSTSCVQIHRSDKFRAHEDTIEKVKATKKVELLTFYELLRVHGEEKVEGVTIFNNQTKEERYIACDYLLLNLGFLTNLGPIKEWGLALDKNTIIVNNTMQTNVWGVYAAGDICSYPGKLKLIATGMGEAGTAANFAKAYIDPSAKAMPPHSSEVK
jgi:ferredoxin/flavodoxin---NADP+ reductase